MRAIPKLVFIRPADAAETVEAWRVAVSYRKGPVAMALSRQALPVIDREKYADATGLQKGAYVLFEPSGTVELILIASGSEVWLCLQAAERLASRGIGARVVSMPSWELFESQPEHYKQSVLPDSLSRRLVVEAGVRQGWERYAGDGGVYITIDDRFGASAPAKVVMEQYGFSVDHILLQAERLLDGKAS